MPLPPLSPSHAASIVAKVTRDRTLRDFVLGEMAASLDGGSSSSDGCAAALSTQFGSGYPADPQTKRWLEASINRVFGFPSLVRFR